MSNIYQHNFDNCLKMRLSNSDYWDLFLCYDCTDEQDNNQILEDCILVDIDINNDNSFSGNTLYSLTTWTGATINGSGITLNDIGLTGIDNGFITYDCTASTDSQIFLSAFTGSTLFLSSADTRFSMTRVTGCTYEYPIEIDTDPFGRYADLCGGFYQGFFKLSDITYFEEITDNKFTWPLEWFTCPVVCSGNTITDCCGTGSTPTQISGSTWVFDITESIPSIGAPAVNKFSVNNLSASSVTQININKIDNDSNNYSNLFLDIKNRFNSGDTFYLVIKKVSPNTLIGVWQLNSTPIINVNYTIFPITNVSGVGQFLNLNEYELSWQTNLSLTTLGTNKITNDSSCCIDPNKAYECYLNLKPIPYKYQILPDRLGGLDVPCLDGWTATFWLNKKSTSCGGNTLNNLYPNNKGFFFYMGTRSENKFWDLFSGETGYTTSSGYPLPPPKETKEVLNNNPFLVYQPGGCCCFTGITTETTQEKDRNADIIDNALGFRIKDDGSIGFRSVIMTGVCSAVTATTIVDCHEQCGCGCTGTTTATSVTTEYLTGTSIYECYSDLGLINTDVWNHVAIRFKPYEQYTKCELVNVPKRKGVLTVYVNGYLKWTLDDFDEFIFRELDEYREKQQGVPFNYSFGGGTQGLLESNTVNGPDEKDENLVIENNFAGSFEGKVSTFKLYGCSLDITTIREEIKNTKNNFYPSDENLYTVIGYIDNYFI